MSQIYVNLVKTLSPQTIGEYKFVTCLSANIEHIGKTESLSHRSCTCAALKDKVVSHSVFPLALARWPMASENYRQTSDFLNYWPRLASGISIIAEK